MADTMSIDKADAIKHDSDDSLDSGAEGEQSTVNNHDGTTSNAQDSQPAKRKGGRKPIYATSEERKQRNRQAQAAFRERRTEYIKQLEETIRVHEQNLHNLQTAHRHAADECLMLRYKNSLLERILLEKGINVQAELRAKTGSPTLGTSHMHQSLVQPPPIPRAILNRHHARRSNSHIAPKIEPVTSMATSGLMGVMPGHPTPTSVVASPKSRPTPPSHSGSPSASTTGYGQSPAASATDPSASIRPVLTAPAPLLPPPPPPPVLQPNLQQIPPPAAPMKMSNAGMPGMMAPASSRAMQQQQRQRQHQLHQQQTVLQQHSQAHLQHQPQHSSQHYPQHSQHQQHHAHAMAQQAHLPSSLPPTPRSAGVSTGPGSFYPVSAFQNHIEQLEQEYEAGDDMIEDPNDGVDTPSGPSPYSTTAFSTAPPPISQVSPATSNAPSASMMGGPGQPGQAGYPSMTQLLDPALDWDPFGLSASMQFPTQFSFDTSNTR